MSQHVQTVVIGAGQAGLSVGYHLARAGREFTILDAHDRVGDSWRTRWDSLRLFTPAKFDGLDGMRFPAPPNEFPTKDQMADYLEHYAAHFRLPVRNGVRVEQLTRDGDRYVLTTNTGVIEADEVVIAMANFQRKRTPSFAAQLDDATVQLHSSDYRNPSQLRDGAVLVVGGGNSGAEIALELSRTGRRVIVAGRDVPEVPFQLGSPLGRAILGRIVLRVVFHRLLTVKTPMGRKARASGAHTTPLIRTKARHLAAAGIERVARVSGVRDGRPLLDDGRVLDVANVIWSTGFEPGFSWIDLPVFDANGAPVHDSGVVRGEPGLFFVGLHFLHAMSSAMVHGVGRDAARIAGIIAARAPEARRTVSGERVAVPA